MDKFPERKRFLYVGDNSKKDFVAPNRLGWRTICLKNDGHNIHEQDFSLSEDFLPRNVVNSIIEIIQ